MNPRGLKAVGVFWLLLILGVTLALILAYTLYVVPWVGGVTAAALVLGSVSHFIYEIERD